MSDRCFCGEKASIVVSVGGQDVPLCDKHWRALVARMGRRAALRGSAGLDEYVAKNGVVQLKVEEPEEVKAARRIRRLLGPP